VADDTLVLMNLQKLIFLKEYEKGNLFKTKATLWPDAECVKRLALHLGSLSTGANKSHKPLICSN
jgi:hypothetical protein